MSLQSNKRSQTKSSSARRKDIYKKSKYYQEKRQKLLIATGIGIFVLVFILILAGIRGCSNYMSSRQAAAKKTVSMNASEDNSQKASSDSQNTDSSNATVSSPVFLTLSVVGDCTLGTDETFDYDTSLNVYYENYGADYFLQNVKDIFSTDDLTIANFEGTLTDSDEREDKTFAFKAPASYASILTGGSVEAVNTANNHSHDYGDQSFDDTLAALDDAGIVHFGYDETAVMDVKGIKVGLVGIYELYDHLEREQQLKDNIAKVKADGAQLIVAIFHWGNETETVPDSNQTTLGRIAIDEGADLVCGHHPHVLQGIETYKGKNIVYSLGNFCFGGNSSPSDMDTMIYQQTFTIDADGVKKDNVTNIIPCSISSAAYDGYNNYQPTPAEGDEATRILGKINERSSWISTAEGSTFTAKYNSNNDSQSSSADTAASDSDIVDMNSSDSDDTDAETYDESYDTDNSDAE
ncbi:MAG: CapA family protein [Lachnospiraceae bacterium]